MSPYNLFQERYRSDPWKLLCCVIMLNQTNGKQLEPIHEDFFSLWDNPMELLLADPEDVTILISRLGLQNRRSKQLLRMSAYYAFIWDGIDPEDLPGIGKYGADSYRIFIRGQLDVGPIDKELRKYLEWRKGI